jgi:hypothetical protein
MRFLVRLVQWGALDEGLLPTMKGVAKSVGVVPRNPKWTSYGALELDIFCPSRADLEVFLAAASPLAKPEFVTDLNRAPEHMTDNQTLSKARNLFNAERYWECHEVLEGLWRQKHGEEKRLLQGIILVCAGFVHHQKKEEVVALGVLKRAMAQLAYHAPTYGGLNISLMSEKVRKIIQAGQLTDFEV